MNSVRRVLAISPYLDDAALSLGATLAEFSARGADVEVLTLFAGAPHEPLTDIARDVDPALGNLPYAIGHPPATTTPEATDIPQNCYSTRDPERCYRRSQTVVVTTAPRITQRVGVHDAADAVF